MQRLTVIDALPWLLAIALVAPACGDDDDTTGSDAGAVPSAGQGGHAGASGRGGSGGSSARAGSGGTSSSAGGASGRGSAAGRGGAGATASAGKGGTGGKAGSGVVGGTGGKGGSGGASGASGASSVKVTDAEIASVLLTANQGEVEQNMVAVLKATLPAVRTLAQDFVDAHGAAVTRETTLYTTLSLTPADNSVSAQLRDTSAGVVTKLNNTSTVGFDRIYLQTQVESHTMALALVDQNLAINASSEGLRTEIATLRSAVQQHLTAASALLAQLDADADAGLVGSDAGL